MQSLIRHPARLPVVLLLAFHAVIVIYPLVWMVTNSFKTTEEIFAASWSMPTVWVVENYAKAWQGGISAYFLNSVIVTGGTILLTLAIAVLAAFGMVRAETAGAGRAAGLVLMACIGGMLVAPQVALVPLYKMMQVLGLQDTRWALILTYTAYRVPITILLVRAVFLAVPRDLDDCAHIDGCSSLQTLWHVYLPMSRSILLTASVLTAYHAWNEFLFAIIFIDSDRLKTIPSGLMNFRDALMTDWGVLVAGLVISAAPIIVMFIVAQRYFLSGFAAGAVKG
jgi:raffinose/stachyose/melibiose transport system permease protein